MPTFAWLIHEKGKAVMSKPLPHTCFAQVPGFAQRNLVYGMDNSYYKLNGEKFILYASCHGSYEDAVLYAEKVNESVLKKYPFTFTAHKYDTEDSPFADKRFEGVSCSTYYGPNQKVSYWALEWPEGTQWDLVYAVTKLIFKNITYGNRTNSGDTHAGMMKILREGGNIFEAMVYSCQYMSNGYGYPWVYRCKESAKKMYKFTQDGPEFDTSGWTGLKLGDIDYFSIGGNHSPIKEKVYQSPTVQIGGARKEVTLSQLRADLLQTAGISNGTI